MEMGRHMNFSLWTDPSRHCTTEIHSAVHKGHVSTLDGLIQSGHDVNCTDIYGNTPLILAVNRASRCHPLDCVRFDGRPKNTVSTDLLPYLLEYPSHKRGRPIPGARAEQPPSQPLEILDLLLRSGVQLNQARKDGLTALHLAVLGEAPTIIEKLAAAGADLEARTIEGLTPFLLAALRAHFDEVDALKRCGADMKTVDYMGRNALFLLVSTAGCADEDVVRLLATNLDQINAEGLGGYTPLMQAASNFDFDTAILLLKLGADPHVVAPTRNGPCTVMGIIFDNFNLQPRAQYMSCLETLIQHGALTSLPQRYYKTLLHLIRTEPKRFVQLMISNGLAPMSIYIPRYRSSLTPLGVALMRDHLGVAEYMVDNWFFSADDVVGSQNLHTLRKLLYKTRRHRGVRFLMRFKSRPMSLVQLSFTAVSAQLGDMVGREERVRALPVPTVVQNRLLFKNGSPAPVSAGSEPAWRGDQSRGGAYSDESEFETSIWHS